MSDYSEGIEEARAALAAEAGDILLDTCTHMRPAAPQPIGGDEADDPETIEEGVPCEAVPMNAFQLVAAQSINSSATHKVKLPATKTPKAGDLLILASTGQALRVYGDVTKPSDLWRFVLGTLQGAS
ncbi:MAG TPA: hypothetical protein VF735_03250 [Pyrinomonadaceae bacterium]|jgi:hypothetical protein